LPRFALYAEFERFDQNLGLKSSTTYDILLRRPFYDCTLNKVFLQDTEFPGVVARPIGEFRTNSDYQYQLLRCNVDMLKIIQLGLTFMNEQGETPLGVSTWQFNFKFNLTYA